MAGGDRGVARRYAQLSGLAATCLGFLPGTRARVVQPPAARDDGVRGRAAGGTGRRRPRWPATCAPSGRWRRGSGRGRARAAAAELGPWSRGRRARARRRGGGSGCRAGRGRPGRGCARAGAAPASDAAAIGSDRPSAASAAAMSALSSLTLISTVCASPSITSRWAWLARLGGRARAPGTRPPSSAGTSAAGWGALIVALKASCVPASPHSTANRPSSRCPIHATATISAPTMTSGSVHTVLVAIRPPTSSSSDPGHRQAHAGAHEPGVNVARRAPVMRSPRRQSGRRGGGRRRALPTGRSQTACRSGPSPRSVFDPGGPGPSHRRGRVDNGPRHDRFRPAAARGGRRPRPRRASSTPGFAAAADAGRAHARGRRGGHRRQRRGALGAHGAGQAGRRGRLRLLHQLREPQGPRAGRQPRRRAALLLGPAGAPGADRGRRGAHHRGGVGGLRAQPARGAAS